MKRNHNRLIGWILLFVIAVGAWLTLSGIIAYILSL